MRVKYRSIVFALLVAMILASCANEKELEQESAEKPEDNRFTPVTMTTPGSLTEPMVFEVIDDKTAFVIERHGGLKRIDLNTKSVQTVGHIPVFTGNEQGLIGFTVDPMFEKNNWAYIYYAHAQVCIVKI
jgi:cytochrome c